MHITKMTGPMRRSLEARLVDLEERVLALERQREADDSLDTTALHRELSRERNQLTDALAGAMVIDDDPFDMDAIELGDTVTVREDESGIQNITSWSTAQSGRERNQTGCRRRLRWALGAALRLVRPISERRQATRFIPGDPIVHALASDPESLRDLGDLPAVLHHGHDRLIALLHDAELHQHPSTSLGRESSEPGDERCQTSPETVSKISRIRCQRSADTLSKIR
jgi:hypothetical protein